MYNVRVYSNVVRIGYAQSAPYFSPLAHCNRRPAIGTAAFALARQTARGARARARTRANLLHSNCSCSCSYRRLLTRSLHRSPPQRQRQLVSASSASLHSYSLFHTLILITSAHSHINVLVHPFLCFCHATLGILDLLYNTFARYNWYSADIYYWSTHIQRTTCTKYLYSTALCINQ